MMLTEAAAQLDTIAADLRAVGLRVASRDDLESYNDERRDLRAELEKIAGELEGEAGQARRVAAWLGEREERL